MAKKLLVPAALLFLATALLASAPLAAEGSWVSVGPWGGSVASLVVHPRNPRILYAGSVGGIYKSTDGGLSWVDIQGSLPSRYIQALAISPSAPETLYVAVGINQLSRGIFHSTNGGASWQGWQSGLVDIDCGCNGYEVLSLAVHPRNPKVALAGVLWGGLVRTTDGGVTWTRLGESIPSALSFDPEQPSIIYAVYSGDVFKSLDGGATWVSTNSGMEPAYVYSIALEPGRPGTLYAGTSSGVFKSTDAAGHWKPASAGLTERDVLSLAVSRAGEGPATVWAGTVRGVFRSRNGGTSWARASLGLRNQRISALAVHPAVPRILWAASGKVEESIATPGIFKSVNGGDRWRISNHGLSARAATSIAVDARSPGVLWAGVSEDAVWRSHDGGATWTERGLKGLRIWDLETDPEDSDVLWSATSKGLFRTTDGGATWQLRSGEVLDPRNGEPLSISRVRLSSSPRRIWIATSRGLFRSADEGDIWIRVPLTPSDDHQPVYDVLIDPRDSEKLVVSSSPVSEIGAFVWSIDGGLSWTSAEYPGVPYALRLARDPADPERIVASGGYTSWIYVSHDGGKTWTVVPTSFEEPAIYSLAIDPVDGSIWAGGWGVYNLDEDGTLREPAYTDTEQALDMQLDLADPNLLYVAAPFRGILKHVRRD